MLAPGIIACRNNPLALGGGVLLAYATTSILWSPGDKLWAATVLASLVVSVAIGFYVKNLRLLWVIFSAFMVLNFLVSLSPDIPHGIFGNPNYLGCAFTLALAGAIAYKLWWFLPFGFLGVYLTHSRGALAGVAVLCLASLWAKNRFRAMVAALVAILFLVIASPERSGAIFARLGIWQDTMNNLTIFGHGFGSFYEAYWAFPIHTNMTLVRASHAYNDVLELLFELGIGVIPLWFILAHAWSITESGQRLILLTFAVLSLTYFPLYIVPLGQLFAATVGHALRGDEK